MKTYTILLWSVVPALIVGYFDSISPFEVDFSLLYFIPIAFACWYTDWRWGIGVAILCLGIWLAADRLSMYHYKNYFDLWWSIVTHAGKFGFVAVAVHRNKQYVNSIKNLTDRLQGKAEQIQQLRELLPVCGQCKKMRTDPQYRQQVEEYVFKYSVTEPAQNLCAECIEQQRPQ